MTGGAGFIGRHTVRHLLGDGAEVLVVDDFSASAREGLDAFAGAARFDAVAGDICDERHMPALFAAWRPAAVVHLAGLVSVARSIADPEESWRLNVQGTRNIARAAASAGARRFVFASSAAVYGDADALPLREDTVLPPALSPYGDHKAACERLLRALPPSSMDVVLLRYFNVYGPGQPAHSPYSGVITRFLDRAARGLPLEIHGDGGQSRDFVSVDDVARVNVVAAGGLPAGTYNVCSGIGTTIGQLAGHLSDLVPGTRVECRPAKPGEIRHSLGNHDALAAAMPDGWHPVALADGLRRLVLSGRAP